MASDYVLIDSYFKTVRAKKHLDELKTALLEFENDDPCAVTIEIDAEQNVKRYKAVFKQPYARTYLIAGDVFQCLRTALDEAVWWLAARKHEDPDWSQFPIFGTRNAKRFGSCTKGLSDRAIELIELVQPYNRPKELPLAANLLWQLHQINRVDKQRRISVRATAARIETEGVPAMTVSEQGCEIAMPLDSEPCGEPVFVPIVVFGDRRAGITMQLDGIEQIYNLVSEVILPRLADCL